MAVRSSVCCDGFDKLFGGKLQLGPKIDFPRIAGSGRKGIKGQGIYMNRGLTSALRKKQAPDSSSGFPPLIRFFVVRVTAICDDCKDE